MSECTFKFAFRYKTKPNHTTSRKHNQHNACNGKHELRFENQETYHIEKAVYKKI